MLSSSIYIQVSCFILIAERFPPLKKYPMDHFVMLAPHEYKNLKRSYMIYI